MGFIQNQTKCILCGGLDGSAVLDPIQDNLWIVYLARAITRVRVTVLSQVGLEIFLAASPPRARRMWAVKPGGEMGG